MFYKLSNTCELLDIEKQLSVKFQYPNLYEPKAIINGLGEMNLPIITSEKPNRINFSIWGLLPEDYDEDWDVFQDITNTLNTNIDDEYLNRDIYSDSLDKRRCLIIVNGFFTSKLIDGKLYPYHIHLKDYKPFCIAGIYNYTSDGFLTCSVLIENSSWNRDIPNFGNRKPLILKEKDYKTWLTTNVKIKDLRALVNFHDQYEFLCHPIKKNFYSNAKDFKHIASNTSNKRMMKIAVI